MKKIYIRIATFLLVFCIAFSSFVTTVSALSWDGSSAGGGGAGSPAGPNGYAIRDTDNNVVCVGYRFSLVDKSGNTKNGMSIDVFRNTSGGNNAYSANYSFSTKYNKKQLINNQNNGYSTSKSTNNCKKEANMGFSTGLPQPSGMGTWQNYTGNLNAVLSTLNAGNINNLKNGDKILVEPLWDVRLQGVYHSLTVTELAIYGKWLLGASSNGGSSSTSQSWGFISSYTNRHFPNALYTPDGQGLWTGTGVVGSSSRATFYDLINKGYGVGIAYTETKPDFSPTLSVNICEAWPGSKSSRTSHYGISNGSAFGNFSYANGYPVMGNTIWFAVNFPAESENSYVRQTVWVVGGGSTSRNVYSNSNTWYDVALSPTAVDAGRSSYTVKARVDWIDGSGNVLKWGAEKTFYIPVRPKINRYQVAMYDITSTQAARNGSTGLSGSVYVGQKVYPKYTYTSSTSWTSGNNFSNRINGTTDLSTSGNINSGAAFERYSSYSPYVVPNVTSIPCVLTTSWTSDSSRTSESTTISIPVVKVDVELKEILLINEDGYYISPGTTLWTYQKVTPQYVYKNNSNCTVYVEGYDSDTSRFPGIYKISPNSQIYVNGKQMTVGTNTTFSVWGGVYLDGAGRLNTSWEKEDFTSQNNNHWLRYWYVQHPLKIQTVTPNSLYRENTQVMTSFKVQNLSPSNFIPSNNISVRFTAYNDSTVLYTTTKSAVVIPGGGDNLVYFKWMVPSGLNGANLTLKGEVIDGGKVIDTQSFVHGTERKPVSQTPDTVFEKSAPSGFSVTTPPVRTGSGSAQWSEWVYQNNQFVRITYGLNLNTASLPVIVPDVNTPSREQKSGVWYMKSGYGFTENWSIGLQTLSGTTAPTTAMYTNAQMAFMYFPEFRYAMTTGSFRVLDQTATNTFQLPVNPNGKNARLHFVPLWFPNTNYRVQGYVADVWTPAGMMSGYMLSAPIVINQSAYDDWFLGR
jgi:hypothetical protein